MSICFIMSLPERALCLYLSNNSLMMVIDFNFDSMEMLIVT